MANQIQHRGPDGSGFYFCPDHFVHLGHRRLAIIDIENGQQPMWNSNQSIGVVFNGEIYNHRELRSELLKYGYVFKTDHSDTEVLIHGYDKWGAGLLQRLNGMFAFCIYDKHNKCLFLARDRFGKKPLYYTHIQDTFIFASELKALCAHPDVVKNISKKSVQKYFGYGFIPAPLSLYENVFKLPAGHFLLFDISNKKMKISQYWSFSLKPDLRYLKISENVVAEELRELLSSAVKTRMIADVPIGVFLSGGIDSSTILACAAQLASIKAIKTFSIGFNEKQFDESDIAREIANIFNSQHAEKKFTIDAVPDVLNRVLDLLDEPIGDSSILPTYLLADFAKQSITVALSGDGGDEMFAGYAPFHALKWGQVYYKTLPQWLRVFISKQMNRLPASEGYLSLDFKLKRTLQGLRYPEKIWNPIWLSALLPDEIAELFNEPVEWDELYSEAISAWNNSMAGNIIDRTIEFYTKFYLPENVLTKVDRASMMVGLEVRSPFLDNHIADFAMRLPTKFKFRHGISKYILKKSMTGILPNSILTRRKKGFGIPLTGWLKSFELIDNKNLSAYNQKFVKYLWNEHKSAKRDNKLFLWNWHTLCHYAKIN